MTARSTSSADSATTPLMRRYFQIKAEYPDAILLFHLGDFFEMFYDDAIVAAKILDLTLTSRNKSQENSAPLCGVPVHTVESYIARLVQAGRKVVVCEQVEDPKLAKGLVKRAVTRVISPGTVLEESSLAARVHNFFMSLTGCATDWHYALCDVSTGLLQYGSGSGKERLRDLLAAHNVRELVYPDFLRGDAFINELVQGSENLFHHAGTALAFAPDYAADQLVMHYGVHGLAALGLDTITAGQISALGGILATLSESKLLKPGLLAQPVPVLSSNVMVLDEATLSHLEIFATERDHKREGSLLAHLDGCHTAMGARLLTDWLRAPLTDLAAITARQDALEELIADESLLQELSEVLGQLPDLERLANRFIAQSPGPREAVVLAHGLKLLPEIRMRAGSLRAELTAQIVADLQPFPELIREICGTLVAEPPLAYKDGGFILPGVNAELDELRALEKDSKQLLAEMELREKQRTGIPSLKVRFNSVFGYYIEITHSHKDKVPQDYIRKQTLTNAERYITDELKIFEQKILSAAERIRTLEFSIFAELRTRIQSESPAIRRVAAAVAVLDVLMALSQVARRYRYVRPVMQRHPVLDLRGARHPVLSAVSGGEAYIANDIKLASPEISQLIITGPNMAGKSTLMRMSALITLMAHVGCFVPCDSATVGLTDRIFTRVGAHDHLQKGLSTFMVEMVETAKILREATPQSLILLDEIGRGTSTFDGLSIAWAVAEDLHDRLSARTLFATHYHELCDLAEQKSGIHNAHMAVKEWNGQIIFLRKLTPGGTNRSYGVAVAAMAGLPPPVILRSREIMSLLEQLDMGFQDGLSKRAVKQMPLFGATTRAVSVAPNSTEIACIAALQAIDVDLLTPLAALNELARVKGLLSR